MGNKKICMCFNDLALYRKAIYKKIDEVYDCDWFIENKDTHVEEFENEELKHVTYLNIKELGPFYIVKGLVKLLWRNYDIYFVLGSTRNISLFFFCLTKHLFFSKKRVYFWTHGLYGKEGKIELFFWKRPLMKMADGIFTYGDYAKDLMINDGFKAEKLFPIHNSLDYDKQKELRETSKSSDVYKNYFNNDYPVVIFIGRLTRIKRLDMLIEAVSILKAKGEMLNLVFIGDGELLVSLKKLAQSKNILETTWFYGASYDEKVNAELIYNADLCVAPGNIGLTAMHVLMFGCPAISHDKFAFQMPEFEAIRVGVTGDFYEYGSIESLADTISNWFKKHNDDREMVRKACYNEIDTNWNPYYQMDVITKNLK